jgi:hypothetical protein
MKNSEFKIGNYVVNDKTGEKGEVVISTKYVVHVLIDFGSGRGRDYLPNESDLSLVKWDGKAK